MKKETLLIVNSKVLPPVFEGIITVKELLASGKAKNVTEAAKVAGISRSAFYKYKDYVCKLEDSKANTLTIEAVLSDKAGVFSAMTKALYEHGVNIITVNQSPPKNGTASVALTVCADDELSSDLLLDELKRTDGIKSVKFI